MVVEEPEPSPVVDADLASALAELAELSAEERAELLTPRLGLWVDVVTARYSTAERYARQVSARLGVPVVEISDFLRQDHGVLRVGVDLGPIEEPSDKVVRRCMIRIGGTDWCALYDDAGIITTHRTAEPRPERGLARVEIVAGRPVDDERWAPELRAAVEAAPEAP